MAELERIYTVPLSGAYAYDMRRRARASVKLLRAFLARHMKAEPENVKLSAGINDLMWSHGMSKPPRRLKLKVSKDAEGIVRAVLLEEKKEAKVAEKPKPAEKKEKKAEKKKEDKGASAEKKKE